MTLTIDSHQKFYAPEAGQSKHFCYPCKVTGLPDRDGTAGGPVDAIYDQVRRLATTGQSDAAAPTPAVACVLWRRAGPGAAPGRSTPPASTTAPDDIDVLLVQRAFEHPYLAGYWGVPGGAIEPSDADDIAAAVREVREEIGLDLAQLSRDRFVPLVRFVTPPDASPVRHDARFFLVEAPPGATPDPGVSRELRAARWLSPRSALTEAGLGELLMAWPTVRILEALATGVEGAPARAGAAHQADRGRRLWPVAGGIGMAPLRTLTLPPATHTNAYVIGTQALAVIDPGAADPAEQAAFDDALDPLIAAGARVHAILLTHHHLDHASGAAHLSERLGAPILCHPATGERLAGRIGTSQPLADGDVIDLPGPRPRRLRALFTPGHAPGHLCFVEEHTGFAAVGDMVASVGTILIDPSEGDMRAYLASLERLAAEGLRVLLPAHGAPIADPAGKLAGYRRHRLWREERVAAALAQQAAAGPVPAADLVPLAYADVPPAIHGLAQRSLLAHLVKLAADGRARRIGEHWAVAG